MFPRMINRNKYLAYLELRKQYDKFLKSLREMRHCDWVIQKKLIEAGGIGDTVYILPARGGSASSRLVETVNRYLEEGKDVRMAQTIMGRGNGKWKITDKQIEDFKRLVLEWNEEEERWNRFYDLTLSSFKDDRVTWEPIIRTHPYMYDNPYMKHWLWDCWINTDAIRIRSTEPASYIANYEQLAKTTYLGKWEDTMCTTQYECEDCVRKCSQFMCCFCENRATCKCAKIDPPEED